MTVSLITGKTGNGKSLFAITEIEKRRLEEKREVYYYGIPNLKLPWFPIEDVSTWYNLPHGAIIVIDEAQDHFRPRPNGSQVPLHVQAFEKHRKQGHDLYVMTQDPSFIDANVRKLVDVHFHLMRKFGAEKSVVHKFFTCRDDVKNDRRDSIQTEWAFPKQNYDLYKSAELHTIAKAVPFKYYLKYILPVIVIGLAIAAYLIFHSIVNKPKAGVVDAKSPFSSAQLAPGGQFGTQNKALTVKEYIAQNIPRVVDLPESAPKYDKVTEAVTAPYPAACVLMRGRCQCYTQQASKLDTSDGVCRSIVERGYFVDWDTSSKTNTARPAPAAPPVAHESTRT